MSLPLPGLVALFGTPCLLPMAAGSQGNFDGSVPDQVYPFLLTRAPGSWVSWYHPPPTGSGWLLLLWARVTLTATHQGCLAVPFLGHGSTAPFSARKLTVRGLQGLPQAPDSTGQLLLPFASLACTEGGAGWEDPGELLYQWLV